MYRASAKDSGAGTAGIGGGPPAYLLVTRCLSPAPARFAGEVWRSCFAIAVMILCSRRRPQFCKMQFSLLRSAADGNFKFGFVVLPILLSCVSFPLGASGDSRRHGRRGTVIRF